MPSYLNFATLPAVISASKSKIFNQTMDRVCKEAHVDKDGPCGTQILSYLGC